MALRAALHALPAWRVKTAPTRAPRGRAMRCGAAASYLVAWRELFCMARLPLPASLRRADLPAAQRHRATARLSLRLPLPPAAPRANSHLSCAAPAIQSGAWMKGSHRDSLLACDLWRLISGLRTCCHCRTLTLLCLPLLSTHGLPTTCLPPLLGRQRTRRARRGLHLRYHIRALVSCHLPHTPA